MADVNPRVVRTVGPDDAPRTGFVSFQLPDDTTDEGHVVFLRALMETIEQRGGTVLEDALDQMGIAAQVINAIACDGLEQDPRRGDYFCIATLSHAVGIFVTGGK